MNKLLYDKNEKIAEINIVSRQLNKLWRPQKPYIVLSFSDIL